MRRRDLYNKANCLPSLCCICRFRVAPASIFWTRTSTRRTFTATDECFNLLASNRDHGDDTLIAVALELVETLPVFRKVRGFEY